MKKKNLSVYLVLVIVIFALVLYFSLKDNYRDIMEMIGNVNVFFLLLGIFFVFMSKYLIAATTYLLSKKEKDNVKMGKILQICLIYPFFAGITPSSVGGESFEIFYLKQIGIPYGKASNIVLQKFILYQIALITVNILAVILNIFTKVVPMNSFIVIAIILNFIVNFIGLGFVYLLGYNQKFNHLVMKKGLSFLHKIRIVKNIDKTRESLDSYLKNFDEGVQKLKKDRKLFGKLIVINIISELFFYLAIIPLAKAMNISGISIVNLFILVTFVKMMSLLVVTPGNSGASEYCFVYLFTGLLDEASIMSFMLLWRVVIYYVPLIVGGTLAIMWGRRGEK